MKSIIPNKCRVYERRWRDRCVDKNLRDEWLEKLNDLSCFDLISICEGHSTARANTGNSLPYFNLRLKQKYLAAIEHFDPPFKLRLQNTAEGAFTGTRTHFDLEWKENLRRNQGRWGWRTDLTIHVMGNILAADDPDFSGRGQWFDEVIERIQEFDRAFRSLDKGNLRM